MILSEILTETKFRTVFTTSKTVSSSCRAITTPISLLGHIASASGTIFDTELYSGTGRSCTAYTSVYMPYPEVSKWDSFEAATTLHLMTRACDRALDTITLQDIYLVEQVDAMRHSTLRNQVLEKFMNLVVCSPAAAGLSQGIKDSGCADTYQQDCSICHTNAEPQNPDTQTTIPTTFSRVTMHMVLNRKRIVSNKKRYQRL